MKNKLKFIDLFISETRHKTERNTTGFFCFFYYKVDTAKLHNKYKVNKVKTGVIQQEFLY